MNCLEAQSKIIPFIDDDLPDDELREFIKHIKTCDNCAEELEIYYTLIVGTRQLDNEENLSSNFKSALDKKLNEEMSRMTTVKRIATSTMTIVLCAVVAGLLWSYSRVLDRVYSYEQRTKQNAQSNYYFSDNFSNVMFYDSDDRLMKLPIENQKEEIPNDVDIMVFLSEIKNYNLSHETYIEILNNQEN